jgi:hypothetical protein
LQQAVSDIEMVQIPPREGDEDVEGESERSESDIEVVVTRNENSGSATTADSQLTSHEGRLDIFN